jgi:hypothetical protein
MNSNNHYNTIITEPSSSLKYEYPATISPGKWDVNKRDTPTCKCKTSYDVKEIYLDNATNDRLFLRLADIDLDEYELFSVREHDNSIELIIRYYSNICISYKLDSHTAWICENVIDDTKPVIWYKLPDIWDVKGDTCHDAICRINTMFELMYMAIHHYNQLKVTSHLNTGGA